MLNDLSSHGEARHDAMSTRRVVITGCGAISPLGMTADALWEGLVQGRSGIDAIRAFDAREFPVKVAGEVKELPPEHAQLPRTFAFAYSAAEEAAKQAKVAALSPDDRCGVFCGVTIDYPDIADVLRAYRGDKRQPTPAGPAGLLGSWRLRTEAIASLVARQLGIASRTRIAQVIDDACASGGTMIGEAFRKLRRGEIDVAVALGATAVVDFVGISIFHKLGALSTQPEPHNASRPFDAQRTGFVMAEGGGAVILESLEHARARGVEPLAEVTGFGATTSAYRISDMPPDGVPQQLAMKLALLDARRTPEEIDYISAHGTATKKNDSAETRAIKDLFGARAKGVPISSIKSMIGHTVTAAGMLEAISCIYVIRHGILPPTINLRNGDPECDLDYVPNVARAHRTRVALSNSFGLGGINSALVIEAVEA
jgi:3-oxoacyl-[acyl-carrier-protein] synthase II